MKGTCLNYFKQKRLFEEAEIDYIEEAEGVLNAFDFKWANGKVRFPESFKSAYPNHKLELIDRENYPSYVGFQ